MRSRALKGLRLGAVGASTDGSAVASPARTEGASSHTNSTTSIPEPEGSWNGLLHLTIALSHHLETEMDRALAIVPLSARGLVVLQVIASQPTLCQQDLALRVGLMPSTMSEMLGRLERQGMVRRDPARRGGHRTQPPRARRAATLTVAGGAALARAEGIATRLEERWAERLAVAAGSPFGWMRAHGLRRWLSQSLAAVQR
jgi:DNA-binding MarR family transcriptional regulator